MKIKFGTDGVRGKYPGEVNEELAFNLAIALSKLKYRKVIVGMDTRESSIALFNALINGFNKSKIKVYSLGVCSTPTLAYLCNLKNSLGVMITASHNDATYNGLKVFFGKQKVNANHQKKIEALYEEFEYEQSRDLYYREINNGPYIKNLRKLCCDSNLKIAMDLSNGGMCSIDYNFLRFKNLEIIGNTPNGLNINKKVGVMYPKNIVKYVKDNKLDIGISFDGDGDRITICDSEGNLYSGDHILYILASYYLKKSKHHRSVVVTEATNMGLIKSLEDMGIKCYVSKVGDHNVYQMMLDHKVLLGGESVGHIIDRRYCQSGDGLLVALLIIKIMTETQKNIKEMLANLNLYYQKKTDLHIGDIDNNIFERIKLFNADNYPSSRILLRRSGTENVLRLLVESEDKTSATKIFNEIKKEIMEKSL